MNDRYPLALSEGTVLSGQFVIYKILGQGGFGITYEAQDHKTGGKVAIKEFFPDSLATRHQGETMVMPFTGERGDNFAYGKECFLQEAETLGRFIGTPGIVRIYSYFEENGTAYFVMDFIEGTSLDDYIKQNGGKLSFEETNRILRPVMDALEAVHGQGVIHRDVAPDNIYITKNGQIKLIDFGAARQSLGDKSQSLDVVLKHGFAPKEQYSRRGKQGPYTDVYALGATFYYALTGNRPVDSIDRMDEDELVPPSKLGVDLPREAEVAIMKSLSVRPSERFQSMAEFKNAMPLQQSDEQKSKGTETSQPENFPDRTVQPQTGTASDNAYNETKTLSSNEIGKPISSDNVHGTRSNGEKKQDTVTNQTKHSLKKEIAIAAILIIAVIIAGIMIIAASYGSASAPAALPAAAATDDKTATSKTTAEAVTDEEENKDTESAAADSEEEDVTEETSEAEAISEEPTQDADAESEQELYPVIEGNKPDNLLNQTCDYNRNGHMLSNASSGEYLYSVSMIDDWVYGIRTSNSLPVKFDINSQEVIENPELEKLGKIDALLVSEEYYFTVDSDKILNCIRRGTGDLIGYRKLNSFGKWSITFTDSGQMCFIDGAEGSQFVSAVPAGDIGNNNPEKLFDLPADITWFELYYDGKDYFTIGYDADNWHYSMNGKDTDTWHGQRNGETVSGITNNGVLYYLISIENENEKLFSLNYIDFKNEKNDEIKSGNYSERIMGPWLCDDGDISIYLDGELVKIPTGGSNT